MQGLEDVSRYPALFAELVRRGWSDAEGSKECAKFRLAGGRAGGVVKLDAAGAPVIGSDGRPVYEMEQYITGSHLETTKEKLSSSEVAALQASYMKGFK